MQNPFTRFHLTFTHAICAVLLWRGNCSASAPNSARGSFFLSNAWITCSVSSGAVGSPEQMWASLSKFKQLPPSTAVFCAHEYTQNNARWAAALDPDNAALQERKQKIDEMRARGTPTIPSVLGDEFATNPFLRPDSASIREVLGVPPDASNEVAFAAIRKHKDSF